MTATGLAVEAAPPGRRPFAPVGATAWRDRSTSEGVGAAQEVCSDHCAEVNGANQLALEVRCRSAYSCTLRLHSGHERARR